MRRGFTLIELLAVVAIIGVMVAAAAASVRGGQAVARVRASARDVFAVIRHARSVALVSQQPAIITYSTEHVDDDVAIKIEVHSAKLMSSSGVMKATTLEGETVTVGGEEESAGEGGEIGSGGETIEEILFAPISTDVVRGMRIKVLKEGEELEQIEEARAKPKISVFSNVDYLIGRYKDAKAAEKKKAEETEKKGDAPATPAAEDQEPVSFVWEVNGRTEPHRLWIYADGKNPEDGISIKIDRFGAAKVLTAEDDR